MSFVKTFLQYTEAMESPESFFRWAGYSAIAAVLRDNVYVNLGITKVWPNLYTILMARSGALRKSVPVKLAGDLIESVNNTKIIRGRSSIQAVIKELGSAETNGSGVLLKGASGIIISEELASLSPDDPSTIPLLTDLYDNHKNWTTRLVGTGKTELKNTCVNLLAASNEPLFKSVYTNLAVNGGLLGRTFLVREEKKRCVNSLMYLEHEEIDDLQKYLLERYNPIFLQKKLTEISKITGIALMDYPSRLEYDTWYKGFQKQRIGDTGVTERFHTSVLKIALIIAIDETMELVIKKNHIEEAINRAIPLLRNYEVVTMSVGKSENAEPTALFLAYLWEHGGKATHQHVMRDNWMHFDGESVKTIVSTLEQAGYIVQKVVDGQAGYELTKSGRGIWEKK